MGFGRKGERVANTPILVFPPSRGGITMGCILAVAMTGLYVIFAPTCVSLFLDGGESAAALDTGITFLRSVAPFYLLPAAKLVADGVLRGGGAMKQFMTSTFLDLILRVVLGYLFAAWWGMNGIWFSWPFGWLAAAAISLTSYLRGCWQRKKA